MFDVIKDVNAEIIIMDQYISTYNQDLYMKVTVDTEVAKNVKEKNFPTYIFNTVNPAIKNYSGDAMLNNDLKFRICYFIMLNCVLQYLHHPDFKVDDKDLSLISNNLNLENAKETLEKHFSKKYGEEKKEHYEEVVKTLFPAISYAFGAFTSYKAGIGEGSISSKHFTNLKVVMGKEFMNEAYGKVGEEAPATTGNSSQNGKVQAGCYIATCVYKSYDCPEVWCLRRYRDNYLAKHVGGRLFIKTYYKISPSLVKAFGNTKWFNKVFKNYLDKKITKLKNKGYSFLPYKD